MLNVINKLLEPIRNKIILMITKAVIKSVNDSADIQLVKVDLGNGEIITSVERLQNFGFTSNPEDGTPALVLCLNGEREHPIIIATDSEDRPNVTPGNSAVYNATGTNIKLLGGDIYITMDNIRIGGVLASKLVNESFKTLFNSHVHATAALGPPVPPTVPMTDLNLTSKTKAE